MIAVTSTDEDVKIFLSTYLVTESKIVAAISSLTELSLAGRLSCYLLVGGAFFR